MPLTSTDFTALPADLVRHLEGIIERHESKQSDLRSWQDLLDNGTDEEIMCKAQKVCGTKAPITFARNYSEVITSYARSIVPSEFYNHPRRPVIMKGALEVAYVKHRLSTGALSPNGYAFAVYNRALRMSKKTLTCKSEISDFVHAIVSKISKKHNVSYVFQSTYAPFNLCDSRSGERLILMKGRWVFLPYEQFKNVEMFQNIIRKAEKLEDRLALLKVARRRERLAKEQSK
jgi:hypothetical protein